MMKFNRIKRSHVIALIVIAAGAFSFRAVSDNYFEISKNLTIYKSVIEQIDQRYVDEPIPGDLVKKSIDAMLKSLDPYTVYYPETDIESVRLITTGKYGGIGATIGQKKEYMVITEPYQGFPAYKANLRAGDILKEIDGNDIKGKNSGEVSKLLKGQAGTSVVVTYDRPGVGTNIQQKLTREEIKIPEVPFYKLVSKTDGIGYIKLTSFTNTASRSVISAFNDLKDQGMKKVVLDLRDNGGGLLGEAVNIVNIFVDQGQEVVRTKGRLPQSNKVYYTKNAPLDTEIPVVILINGHSASASEIVAGTLQDLDRAVVIGKRSFGKGLVQQTHDLAYNSKIKVTTAKYYTPSGRCIQKLDYSNKKKGKAEEVPDSLITNFITKNGRKVHDGRGVDPDFEIIDPEYSNVTRSLFKKGLIFDYATLFRNKRNDSIQLESFSFSNDDYSAFVSFLKDKDYDYKTDTEILLEKLKESAEKEKYFAAAEKEYEALTTKLTPNKENDLELFKEEIKDFLSMEIVTRFLYQKGKIEYFLMDDEFLAKASDVLNSKSTYDSTLLGTNN